MKISSLGICRANHKIYEKLLINDLGADEAVSVIYEKKCCARALPCKLFDLGNEEYVAVTPDLPLGEASYALGSFNANSTLAHSVIHSVQFENAKWQSRLNYRLHKNLCEQIRCYDENHRAANYGSELSTQIVTSCPDHMNFRLRLKFPGKKLGDLHVVILRADNLDLITENYIPMGSITLPAVGPGADTDHQADITVEIPWGTEDMIVYAWEEERPGILIQQYLRKCDWEPKRLKLDNLIFNNAGVDPYYDEWFRSHRATAQTIERQKQVHFEQQPMFSIVVPLYKTPVVLFDEMIGSVEAQSYANWECILVNSTPEDTELQKHIEEAVDRDTRIKAIELEKNLGISLNTNEGIARTSGDYICFFDHDDLLEPDILFEYAKAINDDPQIDMLYCDEDKLAQDGRYTEVHLKPDFNLDLLRNNNYICHMLCVRSSLLAELEPNTKENDGAQDHNTTLQVAERTSHICHVPKVLYHWRIIEGSTSATADAKSYANDAGIKAVSDHLKRVGCEAEVVRSKYSFNYDVRYAVPHPTPLVSVIIPTCDHVKLLRSCLESILEKTTYGNYEIVIVENNSREPKTFDYYESLSNEERVRVCSWKGKGFNFSELVNLGRANAMGEYLLLLNNDTEVITPDWIERMVSNAARPEVGCVGAKLYFPDGTIQHAGVVIADDAGHSFQGLPRENSGYFNLADKQRNVTAVTGACLMVSAELFDAAGGFNPELAVAYNDVVFCFDMLKLGKCNVFLPDVELYHYESVSRGYDEDPKSRARYIKEKAIMLRHFAEQLSYCDPNYNPNLICKLPEACFYHF